MSLPSHPLSEPAGAAVPGSFRDPAGFVFRRGSQLLRQINHEYRPSYEMLIQSGLYQDLVHGGLLIAHTETDLPGLVPELAWRTLAPTEVPFITYPSEWCFSELKAAALATLEIERRALARGMCLKDATAYNIQFVGLRPVHIDTLSFDVYEDGSPWVAYRQFCQHFLAPLLLAAKRDLRLSRLFSVFLDGVPLDLAAKLLPLSSCVQPLSLFHVHLHARFQRKNEDNQAVATTRVSKFRRLALIESLASGIRSLNPKTAPTVWTEYHPDTDYLTRKHRILAELFETCGTELRLVYDLGSNTGDFSRHQTLTKALVVSADQDPAVVEQNYHTCRKDKRTNVLPLVVDLVNPTPPIGFAGEERMSFSERGRPQALLALALVHHLVIAANTPLQRVASHFRALADDLFIEFVGEDDPQVIRLRSTRTTGVHPYTEAAFEAAFSACYVSMRKRPIEGSHRTLYHFSRR